MFFLSFVFIKNNQLITSISQKAYFGVVNSVLCRSAHIVLPAADPAQLSPLLYPLVRLNCVLFYIPVVSGWATFRISQSLSDLTTALCLCVWCHAYAGSCCEGMKLSMWSGHV